MSADEANRLNKRRRDAQKSHIAQQESGAIIHVGNDVVGDQVYPMIIAKTWGDTETSSVNGQVFLDGNDTFWATSVGQDLDATSDTDLKVNHWMFPYSV
jgi:hypothetical protein